MLLFACPLSTFLPGRGKIQRELTGCLSLTLLTFNHGSRFEMSLTGGPSFYLHTFRCPAGPNTLSLAVRCMRDEVRSLAVLRRGSTWLGERPIWLRLRCDGKKG